ncbi:MAG TPA: hypothetical protein VEY70_05425 [Metabacillus sp.]|nr:hypothetical protein [Metabacillus sp.]
MHFEDVLSEYFYHCQAKGFSPKTLKNNYQELNQLKHYLVEKRSVIELESVSDHDLKTYIRYKQQVGLRPQSIVSMFKMVKAFF